MAGNGVLHHLSCPDEVEHRHALRERHEECREEAEKEMLADSRTIRDQKTRNTGDDETDDGNKRRG